LGDVTILYRRARIGVPQFDLKSTKFLEDFIGKVKTLDFYKKLADEIGAGVQLHTNAVLRSLDPNLHQPQSVCRRTLACFQSTIKQLKREDACHM
jgi:hypothetical protein